MSKPVSRFLGAIFGFLLLVFIGVAWVYAPGAVPSRYTGMGATFVTALLPKTNLGVREPLTSLSEDESGPVGVWLRGESKRIIVVIPGLGGNSTDTMNLWFARPFLRRKDHVWILPSPTNASFATAFLKTMDYDESVQSLCRLLTSRVERISAEGIQEVILAGYSLGARHAISMASCLSSHNGQRTSLKLSILALNPPLSLVQASRVLDESLEFAKRNMFSTVLLGGYFLFAQQFSSSSEEVVGFLDSSIAERLKTRAGKFIPPIEQNNEGLKALVASVFSRKLKATYSNVLGVQPDEGVGFFRSIVARSENGVDELPRQEIVNALNATNGRFLVFHSIDDFLIRPESLLRLQNEFPHNVTVHESGGHVGVIFQDDYLLQIERSEVFR
jgi:pimeloyl-ACP methyl ester carboxylesterase